MNFELQAVLDFPATFSVVCSKFSPLICLSYAEFGLGYTADKQQWNCLSAKPTLHKGNCSAYG